MTSAAPAAASATPDAALLPDEPSHADVQKSRSSRHPWTLQTRLTVTVIAIVSVLLVLIAFATSATLRSVLDRQLNDSVSNLSGKPAAQVSGALALGATTAENTMAHAPLEAGVLLLMSTTDGGPSGAIKGDDYSTIALSSEAAQAAIAIVEEQAAGAPDKGPVVVDVLIDGHGTYRATVVDVPGGRVVLGLPVSKVDGPLGPLLLSILIVTVGGLLILGLVTAWVIRSGLRPLRQVVATAERVAALRLDRGEVAITDRVADDAVDEYTEIGRVGTALNTMLDHVDQSFQARARNEELMRRFVADASHELRTPLASIRGYSELSLRAPDNPDTTTSALERIHAQSLRMSRLVEDLLLLARLDEGQELVNAEVDLTPLVIDAVSDARAAGREHIWDVDVTGDSIMVLGDAGRINQVVTNLLANARTHTPEGTTVTLRLTTEPGHALITVHDDGPGIAPEIRDELFDRFARADRSRARKTGGTGLGLSIAKAIADAHGGSLSVASEPGDTTFTFRLPRAPVTGSAAQPPAAPAK